MDTIELNNYIVEVDGGSGVLISSLCKKSTYIYTAKHNVIVDDVKTSLKDIDCFSFSGEKMEIIDAIFSDTVDIAILVTNTKIDSPIEICTERLKTGECLRLTGYPDQKREFGPDRKISNGYNTELFEFDTYTTNQQLKSNNKTIGLQYGNLVGYSGGGVFSIENGEDTYILKAIQSEKDGEPELYQTGTILSISLDKYENSIENRDCFIKKYGELSEAKLKSFDSIVEYIYSLSDKAWLNKSSLTIIKLSIKKYACAILNKCDVDIAPRVINEKYNELIVCSSFGVNEINKKYYWVSFLEFIVVCSLLDGVRKIDENYLNELFKKRKLISINKSEPWNFFAYEILSVKHPGIYSNAELFIKTKEPSYDTVIDSDSIKEIMKYEDIFRYESQEHVIDNISVNRVRKIVDIAALNEECISRNHSKFRNVESVMENFDEIIEKIASLYIKEYGDPPKCT